MSRSTQRRIRAVIVGLGRAGAIAPAVQASDGATVLRSHAAALLAVPAFEIVGLVDCDPARRTKAVRMHPALRQCRFELSVAAIADVSTDLIVLSTPTEVRDVPFRDSLLMRPRLMLVEKPLGADSKVAHRMVLAAERAGVELRVNFSRRFDPAIRRFRRAMPTTPTLVIGRYNKGLRNYASHLIDLLVDWFGPPTHVRALESDLLGKDPNVSFVCTFPGGWRAYVLAVPGAKYDQFEVDFHFPKGRMEMTNNGVEKRTFAAVANLYYPGYAHLVEQIRLRNVTPTSGYVEFYRAVARAWRGGRLLPGCTGEQAATNIRITDAVLRSAALGSREIKFFGEAA